VLGLSVEPVASNRRGQAIKVNDRTLGRMRRTLGICRESANALVSYQTHGVYVLLCVSIRARVPNVANPTKGFNPQDHGADPGSGIAYLLGVTAETLVAGSP
jgi:hypothetical protein